MSGLPDITMQVNLCAGDLAYAEQTVPALIATHRPDVREVLVIADACRPQSTPVLHSPSRFPAAPFGERVSQLRDLCARWRSAGLVDRVVFTEPDSERVRELNRKYCGRATAWTHDHLGHAFAAYFAGWEHARTRYVLHFDADILLYQAPGYSWLRAAVASLEANSKLLAASPRIAPPLSRGDARMVDLSRPGVGWMPTWVLTPDAQGWRSPWFSTRCHLMDRVRLAEQLPLRSQRGGAVEAWSDLLNRILFPLYETRSWLTGGPLRGARWLLDRIARRIVHGVIPPFPLPPEVLLNEHALRTGCECFYLGDERAWYIHPDTKPAAFIELLPKLLGGTRDGLVPAPQRGFTGVRFEDWRETTLSPLA